MEIHLSSQPVSSKSPCYDWNNSSSNGVLFASADLNDTVCPWDASTFYSSLFGMERGIGLSNYKGSRQFADQFSHDTTVRTGKIKPIDPSVQRRTVERDSIAKLPPLEDATVGDMEHNPIPTFNEFHAMLYEGQDVPKTDPGTTRTDTFTSLDRPSVPAGGSSSLDDDQYNGSRSDDDPKLNGDQSGIHDTEANSGSFHSNDITADSNESEHIDTGLSDSRTQANAGSIQTSQTGHSSVVDTATASNSGAYLSTSVTLRRNVAASGCFAKLLEASKAIKNPDAILNGNTDEYMNAPCSAEKWFVIEVCEPVMLREIELANYELFSSRVKLFRVFVSDRYPAKTWESLGTFMALDVKGKQTFKVNGDKLIKYVKFDMMEHYGSEHYCPLTTVRLFGRVSDDLDDEDDELAGDPTLANRPLVPDDVVIHSVSGDQASDTSTVPSHTVGSKASLGSQSTPPSTIASGGSQVQYEPSHEVTTENSSITTANSNSTPPVSNQNNVASHTNQASSAPEFASVEDEAAKSSGKQAVLAEKRTPSSITDTSADICRPGSVNDCLTETPPADTTLNVAHSKVGYRTENSHPVAESQTDPTLTSNATVHATIVPSGTADRVLITGQLSSLGSNASSSFFARVRSFFFDVFGSSFWRTSTESDTIKYNLSAIELCPNHVSAIDALLSYGLLSHLGGENSPDLAIILPERQIRGLQSLAQCFHFLNQKVRVINSEHSNPRLTIQHRVLVLSHNTGHPDMTSCNTASKLLNISFTNNDDRSSPHGSSRQSVAYNILQLFLAYQYRIQLHRFSSTDDTTIHAAVSRNEPALHTWWMMSSGSHELVPHNRSTCPKLPAFLLHLMSLPTMDPPSPSAHNTGGCMNISTRSVPLDPIATDQPTTTSVIREEIVVPAALAGSRRDTALMRLTNRVRLLERNVSVSMRYLEELSQSYKRQMERLSRSFNLTTAWLKATAQGAEERDHAQQVRISTLEQRMNELILQFRSASTEDHESDDFTSSTVSKSNHDVTLEVDKLSAPPPLNFDAPPDWNPSASGWPVLADDWLDDGVVETEDDDPVGLSQHSDRFRQLRPYQPESALLTGDWPSRSCEPPPASGWKSAVMRWFSEHYGILSQFKAISLPVFHTSYTNILWMFYMALVHLAFAAVSHLIVYLAWLRPHSRKLCCSYNSLHQPSFTWTPSNHLTISNPRICCVPNANGVDTHSLTVFPSNGECGIQRSVLPKNRTTVYSKFPQLVAAAHNAAKSEPVDTIGTSSTPHQLSSFSPLHRESSSQALPLNDMQAPYSTITGCTDFSEMRISRLSSSEPLAIPTDGLSSINPSHISSLAPPPSSLLSKCARKRRNRRARAKCNGTCPLEAMK